MLEDVVHMTVKEKVRPSNEGSLSKNMSEDLNSENTQNKNPVRTC
jgi:hypothetical protein